MRSTVVKLLLIAIGALLMSPMNGYAQEATVTGTITDSTGGVLPGVTITALHEASGNTFVGVTDERGEFRLPVRTGSHRITVELAGFANISRTLELLIGQTAVVNLQIAPATVQESVTVTGDAPLVDTTNSSLGSNIDPRQMQELPLNGRNWTDLTMLAAGSRVNAVSDAPAAQGTFQLNVDGQEVTQGIATGFGQPKFSRDAISEFEVISNRFDASQGRSSGLQVNAITKSGTNTPSGSFSGYFRDDRFNAADFVQNRVLPYSDQQLSATFGGPIRRNRIHLFGAYEYERQPQTFTYDSPWPSFNLDQPSTSTEHKGSIRLDLQFSSQTRLAVRGNKSRNVQPIDSRYSGGASFHPSSAIHAEKRSDGVNATLTRVLGARAVNELRVGYSAFWWEQDPVVSWANHPQVPGLQKGTPIILFRGYRVGQGHNFSYQRLSEEQRSVRDDFILSFAKGGRHSLKLGGEYLNSPAFLWHCTQCMGVIDAMGGPPPANIEELFPVWDDVSTWNLAALSPITRFYEITTGQFQHTVPENKAALWIQDDWQVSSRLTLNLGLRYDVALNIFGEARAVEPFLKADRPNDLNNWVPRLGFAYSLNERTVLRGGAGRFYGDIGHQGSHWVYLWSGQVRLRINNDLRSDFAANPFNGPLPTYDQALALWQQGRFTRTISGTMSSPDNQVPYANQISVGLQRQLGSAMSFEADYVFTGSRANRETYDVNLAYNPATGAPYPFSDDSKRPYPGWARVDHGLTIGENNYHGLQAAFTKRMSNRLQASATYSLSGQWNHQRAPNNPGCEHPLTMPSPGVFRCDVPVTLHPVLQDEWYLSDDQRHRATFNGIWEAGYGIQLSGLYFYGDNGWLTPTSGVDVLQFGGAAGSANPQRLRATGTIIERRSFDQRSLHRVDVRVQRRFTLRGNASIDGILEVFNVFNYANYGSYVSNESNAFFGKSTYNGNIAYQPRILQLGFRATF